MLGSSKDDMETLRLAHGLQANWKTDHTTLPIRAAEEECLAKKDCYEVLTEDTPCRVFVDLDGKVPADMSEGAFEELVEGIANLLALYATEQKAVVLGASQWEARKLSFQIRWKSRHGSMTAIRAFVTEQVLPELRKRFTPELCWFGTSKELAKTSPKPSVYVDLDEAVYRVGKMRMLYCSKDGEDRPLRAITDCSFRDTVLSVIPSGSVELKEEPKREEVMEEPRSVATSVAEEGLIAEVLDGLAKWRWDDRDTWLRIGIVLFNEGLSCELWDAKSQTSSKWDPRGCATAWRSFRKGTLTQATLWAWLREDNPNLYMELSGRRTDFWTLMENPSHAATARFFYSLRPDAYLFHTEHGWYTLSPHCLWAPSKKAPSGIFNDIYDTLRRITLEARGLMMRENPSGNLKQQQEQERERLATIHTYEKNIGTSSYVRGVVDFLAKLYTDNARVESMDENPRLLAFSNGKVLDTHTKEVRDLRPSDMCSISTGYAFPKKSRPAMREEVHKILYSTWESEETIRYFLRKVANAMRGAHHEEFHMWTGNGGNGKGRIMGVLQLTFGGYSQEIPISVLTKASKGQNDACAPLALCKGKRLVNTTEPEASDRIQVGLIKNLTGGEPITARALYGQPITFTPQFSLIVQCNLIPELSQIDGGIERRLNILPFPLKFVAHPTEPFHRLVDKSLKDRLRDDEDYRNGVRDEMMLLLIEHLGEPIEIPPQVEKATRKYLLQNNPVKVWLDIHYELGGEGKERASDLLFAFKNDMNEEMSPFKFRQALLSNGLAEPKHTKTGAFYHGIQRKAEVVE